MTSTPYAACLGIDWVDAEHAVCLLPTDGPPRHTTLARLLRERLDRLRPWKPDDALTRALRLLATDRREWVDQRTALGNRLLRHLKESYALAFEFLGQNVYGRQFLELLAEFPTQAELQRASPQQLARSRSQSGPPAVTWADWSDRRPACHAEVPTSGKPIPRKVSGIRISSVPPVVGGKSSGVL